MLKEARFEQVYIVCGYTDMRRSIDGLAGIVKQNFGLEPCSGSLFLFCGKRRDRMKALLWEGDGFLLLYKRLDNGYFQWPRNGAEAKQLTHEQYIWLLQGLSIEQPKAIKPTPKRGIRPIIQRPKTSNPLLFYSEQRVNCYMQKSGSLAQGMNLSSCSGAGFSPSFGSSVSRCRR